MLEEIRNHLQAAPFEPFSVVTSGGREYAVETGDHADLSPNGRLLHIWLDGDGGITVSLLHITAVHKLTTEAEESTG